MLRKSSVLACVALLIVGCSQSPSGKLPTATQTPAAQSAGQATQPVPPAVTSQPQTPDTAPAAAGNPPASVQDLLSQARQAAQQRDPDGAIRALEQALALEPNNSTVLALITEATEVKGMSLGATETTAESAGYFMKAAEYYRKLRESGGTIEGNVARLTPLVLYNEACAFASQKQTEKAVASLGEAFDAGFTNFAHLDQDADFNAIRQSAEFQAARKQAPINMLAKAKFDFDFSLPDLDGKTVSLAAYKGKVVIVDVWGTWCPPCRMEIPHFVELHKKYREAGLEIIGVNYEQGIPPEKVSETVKKFVEENGVSYPCVIGDLATQRKIPNLEAFPTTLFLDHTGKVRLKLVGYNPLETLEEFVTLLLAGKSSAPAAN